MIIQHDKIDHFIMGALIVLAVVQALPLLESFSICIFIAAMKELLWDWKMKMGTPDWRDFLATLLGGSVGVGWVIAAAYL